MTVQSIDKRTAADSSTTSTAQDRQGSAATSDDAFVALLRQASQRFSSQQSFAAMSPNSVLADHFNAVRADAKDDAQWSSRDTDTSDRTSARTDKSAAKADRPSRQDQSAASSSRSDRAAKADRSDDASADAAPARAPSDPAPDDSSGAAGKADAGATKTAADDQPQAAAAAPAVTPPPEAPAVPVQPVAAPVQAQTDPIPDNAAAAAETALAGQARPDQIAQNAGSAATPPSQQKSAGPAQEQASNDDAASLAADLTTQADATQAAAAASANAKAAVTDAARGQADDLAARLADTGAAIQVKVQTGGGADAAAPAVAAADTVVQPETIPPAGQGNPQTGAGQGGQDPNARFGAQSQAADTPSLAPAPPAEGDSAQAQQVNAKQPADAFAAILAAQSEASGAADAAAPETRPVAGLTALTGAQAADKATPAQTAPAVRTPRVPMPAQVQDQINVQIDKAVKEGSDTVKIQLRPLDLGRIEIKLDVGTDGKVAATVTADKPETLAMLQKDSRGLEKALEDAGLKPDSSSTSFNLRGGEQQPQQQQQAADSNGGQGRSARNRGREFGTDEDLLAAAQIQASVTQAASGRSGVDISV